MIKERITDGRRIAELLASELDGLETGSLSAVGVVDADPDAEAGDIAYWIAYDGRRIASVSFDQSAAFVSFEDGILETSVRERTGLRRDDATELIVETGAAVKHAADVIRAAID
ncbi:MAG: hypothetical protein ABEH64_01410 [Salinirussus sp.]